MAAGKPEQRRKKCGSLVADKAAIHNSQQIDITLGPQPTRNRRSVQIDRKKAVPEYVAQVCQHR
ncbi:hypothetical protein GCM10011402_30070 [Paracoccus acridae]|uniref:Uncharacterized protein n=1 Tax=Paracoccus acridae TaxID=1795310 RepID=A0ABQ1VKR2_9RHOB|nr:hypothetical protein GCM10011402_30070 [Paracoccus acridae]